MARLAIISSYNENCGNASYTHVLKNGFLKHVQTEVIALDLFVLQKPGINFRKIGDKHIRDIAARLREFDYVNIQFEAGLYGASIEDIRRRVTWLIEASRNLIFTMHRVDPVTGTVGEIVFSNVKRLKFRKVYRDYRLMSFARLYYDLIKVCERQAKTNNVWVAVHTRRELRIVRDYYGVKNVFDHPLVFLTREERQAALALSDRQAFRKKYKFGENSKIIGMFGYIADYKGMELGIQALNLLPSEYQIAIFGSQHPQSIKQFTPIDGYLENIIETIDETADKHVKRTLKRVKGLPKGAAAAIDPGVWPRLIDYNLRDRVRFMGNLQDPEFIEALRLCDAVVLPYLEVGQSMSGVVVLALESGGTVFCSNNFSFFEVRKYFGETFETFDMGNFVELAQKIQLGGRQFEEQREIAFQKFNIENFVKIQLAKFGFNSAEGTGN